MPLVEGRVLPSYGKVPTVQDSPQIKPIPLINGDLLVLFFVYDLVQHSIENPMRGGSVHSGLSLYAGIVAFV